MGQSQSQPRGSATLTHSSRTNARSNPISTSNLPLSQVDLTSSTNAQSNPNAEDFPPPHANVGGRRRAISTLLRKKRPASMVVSSGVDRQSSTATGPSQFGHSNLNQRPTATSSSTTLTPATSIHNASLPVSPSTMGAIHEDSGGPKPEVAPTPTGLEGQPIPRRGFKGRGLSNLLNRRSWAGHARGVVSATPSLSVMSSSKAPTAHSSSAIPPYLANGRLERESTTVASTDERKIEVLPKIAPFDRLSRHDETQPERIRASEPTPSAVLASTTAQPALASGSGSSPPALIAIRSGDSVVSSVDHNRSELLLPSSQLPKAAPATTYSVSEGKRAGKGRGVQEDLPRSLNTAKLPTSQPILASSSSDASPSDANVINTEGPQPIEKAGPSSISAERRKIAMLSGTQPSEEPSDSTSTSPISSSSEPLEQDPAFMDSPPSSAGFDVQQEVVPSGSSPESLDCSLNYHDARADLSDDEPRDEPGESPYSLRNLVQQIRRVLENIESNMADERVDPGASDEPSQDSQPEHENTGSPLVPMDALPFLPPPSSDTGSEPLAPTHDNARPSIPEVSNSQSRETNSGQSSAALLPSASPTASTARGVPSLPIIPAGTTMIVQGVVQTADGPPPSYTPSSPPNTRQPVVRTLEPTSGSPSSRRLSENIRRERPRSFLSRARAHSMFSNSQSAVADELGQGDSSEPTRLSEDDGNRSSEPASGTVPAPALRTSSDNPSGAAELLGALLIAAASATANMLLSEPPEGSSNNTQQTAQTGLANQIAPSTTVAPTETASQSMLGLDSNDSLSRAMDDQSAEYLGRLRRNLLRHRNRPRSRSTPPLETESGDPTPSTPPTDTPSTPDHNAQSIASDRRRSSVARERPRSIMNNIRDRWFGNGRNGWDDDVDEDSLFWPPGQQSDGAQNRNGRNGARNGGAEDAIEALRERIASELMRALARESPETGNGGSTPLASGSASLPPASTPSSSALYPQPMSPDSSPSYIPYPPPPLPSASQSSPNPLESILGLSRSLAASPATQTTESNLPAEGTFDRFLHDTSIDLRNTLVERMQRRQQALNTPLPLAIPNSTSVSSSSDPHPVSDAGEAGASNQSSMDVVPASRSAPPQVITRPQDGIIEPRLNWWRMHQFPARTVQYAGDESNNSPGAPPSQTATQGPTNSAETSDSSPTNISTLIPVIVVGIRTAPTILVQDIAALTSPPAAAATPRGRRTTSRLPRPLSSRIRGSSPITPSSTPGEPLNESSISAPSSGSSGSANPNQTERTRTSRTWSSRFARVFARNSGSGHDAAELPAGEDIEAPSNATTPPTSTPTPDEGAEAAVTSGEPPETAAAPPRDRTRNYLIWVIGGYYPPNHPILVSPNLLLNHFDHEDLWGLADLLGQVKPPVASRSDIDEAGLEIIKGASLSNYEKDGKVKSNTADRCAICLGDYEAEEDLRIMSCQHVFHRDCVDKWLEEGRNNCPACRTKGVPTHEAPTATA